MLPTPTTTEIIESPRAKAERMGDRTERCIPNLASGAVFGLLPTPTASDSAQGAVVSERDTYRTNPQGTLRKVNGRGTDGSVGLGRMAAMELLPTPTTVERSHPDRVRALKDAGAETMASRKNGSLRPNGLTDRLMFDGLIPTPQAWDGMRGGQRVTGRSKTQPCGETFSANLNDLARSGLLPRPAETRSGRTPKTSGATSLLNPRYVAEMMNFPTDYLESPFQNGE